MEDYCEYFKIEGAGNLQLGKDAFSVTGRTAGFHLGVSWSQCPYVGGVISRSEAKRLADHIYKALSECDDTEIDCVTKAYERLDRM